MKYKYLLKLLQILIYGKRFVWWLGPEIGKIGEKMFSPLFGVFAYFYYRADSLKKRAGSSSSIRRQMFRRDNLQIVILLMLFILAIPQTKLYGKTERRLAGQKSIAYNLAKEFQEFDIEIEEVKAGENSEIDSGLSSWREGTISSDDYVSSDLLNHERQLASNYIAGGTAVTKPIIFPGTFISGKRTETIEYVVQKGDTISAIAFKYGISVATILWENGLTANSFIRPGDSLQILPVSGITHKVISGDSLIKIASNYGGEISEIAKFNNLEEDGSDLKIGQRLLIPNGVKIYSAPIVSQPIYRPPTVSNATVPASSVSQPSSAGFVWPCEMRTITQYYGWYHQGLDVSGSISRAYGSAIYASKAGTVEISQCGWNMGYGCYIIIDHGGGYKTLYGHNSKLLVSPGQYVSTGQTIGLMGNTGRVYGYDGTHIHFEVRVNGVRVNPLNYVR